MVSLTAAQIKYTSPQDRIKMKFSETLYKIFYASLDKNDGMKSSKRFKNKFHESEMCPKMFIIAQNNNHNEIQNLFI